jgi:hypothetical protein
MEIKKMFKIIEENPKSCKLVLAIVITILQNYFIGNEVITSIFVLISAYAGVDVKNFFKGAVEPKDNSEDDSDDENSDKYDFEEGNDPTDPESFTME